MLKIYATVIILLFAIFATSAIINKLETMPYMADIDRK